MSSEERSKSKKIKLYSYYLVKKISLTNCLAHFLNLIALRFGILVNFREVVGLEYSLWVIYFKN